MILLKIRRTVSKDSVPKVLQNLIDSVLFSFTAKIRSRANSFTDKFCVSIVLTDTHVLM